METLLVIFIGLVALALVILAACIGAMAWYVVVLLREVTIITKKLHSAGELVAEDLAEMRQQLKGGQFIYSLVKNIWPRKKTTRRSLPPQE